MKFIVRRDMKYNGKYFKPKSIVEFIVIDKQIKNMMLGRIIVPLNNNNEVESVYKVLEEEKKKEKQKENKEENKEVIASPIKEQSFSNPVKSFFKGKK